jgi:hypothetical protein
MMKGDKNLNYTFVGISLGPVIGDKHQVILLLTGAEDGANYIKVLLLTRSEVEKVAAVLGKLLKDN